MSSPESSNDIIFWHSKTYYRHKAIPKITTDTIDYGGFLIITITKKTYYDHFPCDWRNKN